MLLNNATNRSQDMVLKMYKQRIKKLQRQIIQLQINFKSRKNQATDLNSSHDHQFYDL